MARLTEGGAANDLERRVGGQLQAVRRHRGWSLRELAEASGLSLTTVHQSRALGSTCAEIETGRTSPGLGTLQSLATASASPWARSSMGTVRPPRPCASRRASGWEWRSQGAASSGLASGLASQRLRGLVLTLGPQRETGPAPLRPVPARSLVLGLEGVCVYEVAGQRFSIETGDSLLFEASQPHRALNPGSRPARVLLALYAPEEEPGWIESHVTPGNPVQAGKRRSS